jgi:two-component system, LytTR family, sensor kinase
MNKIRPYQIIFHLLFWILYTLIFYALNKKYNVNTLVPFNTFITTAVQIGLIYFIRYYLFPKYYQKGRPVFFSFLALSSILYFIPIVWMVAMIIFKINVTFSRLLTIDLLFAYLVTMVIVFISVLVTLLIEKERKKNELSHFEKEKKEMELFALKSQIDSHFLFNTLNNIYGLALKKSDLTPQSVLYLSEILNFVIYETKKDFYPLSKEIQLIKYYIELEKMRYGDSFSIGFEATDVDEDSCITPLILFTFLENSFKHGISKTMQRPWVKIRLKSSVSEIFFEIENSVPLNPENVGQEGSKGIGLENIRRRLALLYPQMHKLITRRDENSFYAGLTLYKNY